jgi:hypothetical protein
VYLKSAFTPSLDDTVQSLFEARCEPPAPRAACVNSLTRVLSLNAVRSQAFGEEGKLIVHYATTPAWG